MQLRTQQPSIQTFSSCLEAILLPGKWFSLLPPQAGLKERRTLRQSSWRTPKMQILLPDDHGRAQRGPPGSPRSHSHSTTLSCCEESHVPYSMSCIHLHVASVTSRWLLAENEEFSHGRTIPGLWANNFQPIFVSSQPFPIDTRPFAVFPVSKVGLSPSQVRNKLLVDGTISQEQESKQQANKKWSWFSFLLHNDPNYTISHHLHCHHTAFYICLSCHFKPFNLSLPLKKGLQKIRRFLLMQLRELISIPRQTRFMQVNSLSSPEAI